MTDLIIAINQRWTNLLTVKGFNGNRRLCTKKTKLNNSFKNPTNL
ncbi:hypothetical protein EV05_1311 [Prochlorococcus sp. MIT 0601]|nr:hypothetical protein EV05_1311 [Prochlorococcus sp. MIT 0601]